MRAAASDVCVAPIVSGSVYGWDHALGSSGSGADVRPLLDVRLFRVPAAAVREAQRARTDRGSHPEDGVVPAGERDPEWDDKVGLRLDGRDLIADWQARHPDGAYVWNREQLEAARTERTKALVFVSPSNPTGAVFTREEMEAIGRWAVEHGLWVVTDEIYEHIAYDGNEAVTPMAVAPPISTPT